MDEMHLLLKEEQTAAYSVEIWKRFRKWGGIPTGLTQNVKDLLSSREVENIFENSDMIIMLNQAAGDRQILAKQLNISPHQLSYVTHSGEGEGLLFFGNVILPFVDRFPTDLELYRIMTTYLLLEISRTFPAAFSPSLRACVPTLSSSYWSTSRCTADRAAWAAYISRFCALLNRLSSSGVSSALPNRRCWAFSAVFSASVFSFFFLGSVCSTLAFFGGERVFLANDSSLIMWARRL